METVARLSADFSEFIDRMNRWAVGLLMALLILTVWTAVLDRYLFKWQIGWVEELARYLMIWAILLAVPCCVVARQHVRLAMVSDRLPGLIQKPLSVLVDLITIAFFAYIAISGVGFAQQGMSQLSTVFRMPMVYPFAAIPTAFGLAALQAFLTLLGSLGTTKKTSPTLAGSF